MKALAVIGGLDPTGGAGLLRDRWAAGQRGPGLSLHAVITAQTRQGHGGPAEGDAVDQPRLRGELEQLLALPDLGAVKLGMIPDDAVELMGWFLAELRGRAEPPAVVMDPVLQASDGGQLGAAPELLRSLAAHRVDLLTPNLDEAQLLAPEGVDMLVTQGGAVLLKGERVPAPTRARASIMGERVRDRLLFPDGGAQLFERPRVLGPEPRGTGCALATAIACELAQGRALVTAVAASIAWLDRARCSLHPGPDQRWHLSP